MYFTTLWRGAVSGVMDAERGGRLGSLRPGADRESVFWHHLSTETQDGPMC